MSFYSSLSEYIQYLEAKNYAKNTLSAQRRIVLQFFRYLNERGLTDFREATPATVIHYRDYLKKGKGYSHNYIYLQMGVIKSFYRFLYERRLIKDKSLTEYSYLRPIKDLPKEIPAEEELSLLLDKDFNKRDKAILELYYGTGLRHSELIRLNRADIDFSQNLVFVHKGKGKKDRLVPVTDYALGLVSDYLRSRKDKSEALFLSSTGKRIDDNIVTRIFKKLNQQSPLGKNVTPHTLRHCFATHLLRGGAKIRQVQEILGHEDMGTTQRYTHLEITDLKQAIKRFHPTENELYSDEPIPLPGNQFFKRKPGCKRKKRK